ncbi:hypothetical protein OK016_21990 [Vibrio chagasii]|nr:hypothetical protein [Vibrio chagasii]
MKFSFGEGECTITVSTSSPSSPPYVMSEIDSVSTQRLWYCQQVISAERNANIFICW